MKTLLLQTVKSLKSEAKKLLFRINDNKFERIRYENDIKGRAKLPFTEIAKLSKDIYIYSPHSSEILSSNDYYAHASTLKKYLKLKQKYQFKFIIEHGISVGSTIVELEKESPFRSAIVCSKPRANIWRKEGYHSYSIGPYINYAKPLLTKKQYIREKTRLGNNLLVFPAHSTKDVSVLYNVNNFCKIIEKYAKKYDSVRVCLYWKDILMGIGKIYQSYGFECVTAGHILDYNFLSRLKSIIETSTETMSNDLGSYSGYSLFLGKPHFIIKQELSLRGRQSEIDISEEGRRSTIFNKMLSAFSQKHNTITKKQLQLANYYYGFDKIKTKNELLKIVSLTEKLYANQK